MAGPESRSAPGLSRKEKTARERVLESKLSDLESAMDASKHMCLRIDEAIKELREAFRLASNLESAPARGGRASTGRFSRDLSAVLRGIESIRDRASQAAGGFRNDRDAHLEAHAAVCSRVDAAAARVRAALEAAALLDRSSGSGFNVEARLNRRLGVREVVRTLHASYTLLSRAVKVSRARANSHGRILVDVVDDTGPAFE